MSAFSSASARNWLSNRGYKFLAAMKVFRSRLLCLALGMSVASERPCSSSRAARDWTIPHRAEGTGVQIIGAVVVLARYRASAHQKAVAEQHARAAVVQAAKPAYQKRRASLQTPPGQGSPPLSANSTSASLPHPSHSPPPRPRTPALKCTVCSRKERRLSPNCKPKLQESSSPWTLRGVRSAPKIIP